MTTFSAVFSVLYIIRLCMINSAFAALILFAPAIINVDRYAKKLFTIVFYSITVRLQKTVAILKTLTQRL